MSNKVIFNLDELFIFVGINISAAFFEKSHFFESTRIYHYPIFCCLRDKGFNCSVIHPIITKNITNMNITKVHNDRFDSKTAALVGLKPDLKVSLMHMTLS